MEENYTEKLNKVLAEISAANDDAREDGWIMSEKERQSAYEFLSNIQKLAHEKVNEFTIRNYANQGLVLYDIIHGIRNRANEALDALVDVCRDSCAGKSLEESVWNEIEELRDEMLGAYQLIERLGDIWDYDRNSTHEIFDEPLHRIYDSAKKTKINEFFRFLKAAISQNKHQFNDEFRKFSGQFIYRDSTDSEAAFSNAYIGCLEPGDYGLYLALVLPSEKCNIWFNMISISASKHDNKNGMSTEYEITIATNGIPYAIEKCIESKRLNEIVNRLDDLKFQFTVENNYYISMSGYQKSLLADARIAYNSEKRYCHIPDENETKQIIALIKKTISEFVSICNEYCQLSNSEDD